MIYFPNILTYFEHVLNWLAEDPNRLVALGTLFLALFALLQWRETRRSSQRQLRAYVGIDAKSIDLIFPRIDNPQYEVSWPIPPGEVHKDFVAATIKNYGQTPAMEVLTHINWVFLEPFGATLQKNFDYKDYENTGSDSLGSRPVLDAQQTHLTKVMVNTLKPFRSALSKTASLYLYGRIDYIDIYKCRWRRKFCYRFEPWHPQGEQFVPHWEHNEESRV